MGKLARISRRMGPLLTKSELLVPVLRHPATPARVRLLILGVFLYLFVPFDLISELLPLLGILDDSLVVLAGLTLALRWTPTEVLAEAAHTASLRRRRVRRVLPWALVIVLVWGIAVWALAALIIR